MASVASATWSSLLSRNETASGAEGVSFKVSAFRALGSHETTSARTSIVTWHVRDHAYELFVVRVVEGPTRNLVQFRGDVPIDSEVRGLLKIGRYAKGPSTSAGRI
jgi:hypothetical protein